MNHTLAHSPYRWAGGRPLKRQCEFRVPHPLGFGFSKGAGLDVTSRTTDVKNLGKPGDKNQGTDGTFSDRLTVMARMARIVANNIPPM